MVPITISEPVFDTTRDDRPNLPPPPPVAITPVGDPWPRPYYLENGLRRVAPYHYTYNTFCKQRWRDREILDIFAAEFRDRSREYYKEAIESGRIVLNGSPCKDIHTRVKNGDVISHTLHRHEPPVTAQPIRVIHEDDGMIVIDKPAGVPVHPAGRYKFNSVIEIMRAERHHAFNPLPCNRLDRLTSGVMFVGKTSREAEDMSARLRGRTVRKEYVARVKGRFPDGENWGGEEMTGGIVTCEEPILQISPILGLNRARASGKSAKTLFRRIAYHPPRKNGNASSRDASVSDIEDEGYSVVHCLPLTGRTHQIRVHLQFLGHPISNDPIYSNRKVFGASLGKGDATDEHDEEIKAELSKMGKTELASIYSYDGNVAKNETKQNSAVTDETNKHFENMSLDQTRQITRTELEMRRAEELHRKYGPTADYKPLHHGTLHASSSLPLLAQSGAPSANNVHPQTDSDESNPEYQKLVAQHDEMVQDYNRRKGEKLTGEVCSICETPLYSDPGPQELGIYLHALAYASVGGEWRYKSPLPQWAKRPAESTSTSWPDESPEWNYGDEKTLRETESVNVELEKEEAEKRNKRGMVKNRGLKVLEEKEYDERLMDGKEELAAAVSAT